MSWNYRIFKKQYEDWESYGISEVHYDEGGVPIMYSGHVSPYGETPEELLENIKQFSVAFAKPILTEEDFNNGQDQEEGTRKAIY